MGELLRTTIEYLNVGFGECTVVRINRDRDNEKVIVIDGGDGLSSIYQKCPSRFKLIDYLTFENINTIDLLIMTHPHPDHIVGLVNVIEKVHVKEAWSHFSVLKLPNHVLAHKRTNMLRGLIAFEYILRTLKEKETVVKMINVSQMKMEGPLALQVYLPSGELIERMQKQINQLAQIPSSEVGHCLNQIDKQLNELSLSVALKVYGKELFITADVQIERLEEMHRERGYNIDILQAPHHGDRHHLSLTFLKKANPNFIIVSADDEGTYSLPSKDFDEFVHEAVPEAVVLYTAYNEKGLKHHGIRVEINEEEKMSVYSF